MIVHLLEEAGWEARWIKHWTGRREFCTDAGVARAMPAGAAARFAAIHERAAALRGAGSWDIFGWRRDDYVFIESKQHRSSDRLNKNQLAWLEAALESGVSVDSFAVVEYDASRPTRQNERLVGELRAPDLHEET